MKAADIPKDLRSARAHVESFIQGPRWEIDEGWLDRQVISYSKGMKEKGWEPLRVAWQRSTTSLTQRCIVYRLEGQAYPLQYFGECIERLANR